MKLVDIDCFGVISFQKLYDSLEYDCETFGIDTHNIYMTIHASPYPTISSLMVGINITLWETK